MSQKTGFSRRTVFKNIAKRVRSAGKAIASAFGASHKPKRKKVVRRRKKR